MTSIRFMIVLNTVQFNLGFTIYSGCIKEYNHPSPANRFLKSRIWTHIPFERYSFECIHLSRQKAPRPHPLKDENKHYEKVWLLRSSPQSWYAPYCNRQGQCARGKIEVGRKVHGFIVYGRHSNHLSSWIGIVIPMIPHESGCTVPL